MATEEWKLQVSYKTPSGDLINIRAKTAEELSVMLEGVSDYSTQIAATGKLIQGAYTVSPLGTTGSTAGTMQMPTSTTAPQSAPSATAGLSTPTCVHGPRTHRSGVAKATGKPYAFWSCPLPQGPEQCKPAN
jgi:anthranilate phosphoribosyltransferase